MDKISIALTYIDSPITSFILVKGTCISLGIMTSDCTIQSSEHEQYWKQPSYYFQSHLEEIF